VASDFAVHARAAYIRGHARPFAAMHGSFITRRKVSIAQTRA
jgi:hypothetical protein